MRNLAHCAICTINCIIICLICTSDCDANGMTVQVQQSSRAGFTPIMNFRADEGSMLQVMYKNNKGTFIVNCQSIIPNKFKQLRVFATWFKGGRKMISNVTMYTITVVERSK